MNSDTSAVDRDEEFEHQVQAWTVGDLRRALADVPDDTPLEVVTAEQPGGMMAGDTQVVVAGDIGKDWVPPARGETDGHFVTARRYELELDFPSGTYVKPRS